MKRIFHHIGRLHDAAARTAFRLDVMIIVVAGILTLCIMLIVFGPSPTRPGNFDPSKIRAPQPAEVSVGIFESRPDARRFQPGPAPAPAR